MLLFYTPHIDGDHAELPEDEARHVTQVLRRKVGDTLVFTDGKGYRYEGAIDEVHKKRCALRITHREYVAPPASHLHLCIAPTKNSNRLEWMLEKCVEIGIGSVHLMRCRRSERTKVRLDRLERIAISAMKQSLHYHLPDITELTDFSDMLTRPLPEQRYIAWCETDTTATLWQQLDATQDAVLLIGPEGDFTAEEVAQAKAHGCVPVSLGEQRLRVETAGLLVCNTYMVLRDMQQHG